MVWQEVIEGGNVWIYEYVANGYKANAIALPLDEGDIAIISPPIGLSEADFAAIDQQGKVVALIAPSAGHNLGQNEWQARYRDCDSLCTNNSCLEIDDALSHLLDRAFRTTGVSRLC